MFRRKNINCKHPSISVPGTITDHASTMNNFPPAQTDKEESFLETYDVHAMRSGWSYLAYLCRFTEGFF